MYMNSKTGCIAAGGINNPEFKLVGEKQTALLKFSLAVGKDESGSTIWFNCQAWNPIASHFSEKLKKGDRYIVAGTWENREYNGKTYHTLIVDALIDGAAPDLNVYPATGYTPVGNSPDASAPFADNGVDDDLPF
jgi:single-stranded DNA-binding protein